MSFISIRQTSVEWTRINKPKVLNRMKWNTFRSVLPPIVDPSGGFRPTLNPEYAVSTSPCQKWVEVPSGRGWNLFRIRTFSNWINVRIMMVMDQCDGLQFAYLPKGVGNLIFLCTFLKFDCGPRIFDGAI